MTHDVRFKISRFERVTNLALTLMSFDSPITLRRLVDLIPGYPKDGDEATIRMAFERDKRILRDQGIAIVTADAGDSNHAGYTIDTQTGSDEGVLVDFNDEEVACLATALSTFRFENGTARDALIKLVTMMGNEQVTSLFSAPIHRTLQGAIDARRPVRLISNNRSCDVEPYGMVRQPQGWLLIGRDQHFEGVRVRSYRVDDISLVFLGAADSYVPPLHFDPTAAHSIDAPSIFDNEPESLEATVNRAVDAGGRFGRLTAILSYLAVTKTLPTTLLAHLLQLRPQDLIAELETASCCGVAPYTPDRLLDIMVDDHTVEGYRLEDFSRSTWLTSEEIVVAARAARELLTIPTLERCDALRSAITKCETHTGVVVRYENVAAVSWPSEWSTLVRLRLSKSLPLLDRLVIDEPTKRKEGSIDVVAFLADRRWRQSLLDTLGHNVELVDVANSGSSREVPDRRAAA